MTDAEVDVMNKTGDLWNRIITLPFNHPDDIPDLKFHIHAIQNIILARVGQRAYDAKVENGPTALRYDFVRVDSTSMNA